MVPAMFIFGDSLIDNGNNNNLPSLAKANYFPYGIDFNGGPTGRFSNGYTMVDEIGILAFSYFSRFPSWHARRIEGKCYDTFSVKQKLIQNMRLGARFTW